jgi:hypothetical protein
MTSPKSAEYDSPRKEILELYLCEFMSFFFPSIYPEIDWRLGWEFLDKELQQVVRDAETGRRFVDKLVKVWRFNGEEAWVLLHIEVQGQKEVDFSKRMYIYHYRLMDRYDRPVISLAVLTDEHSNWRPNTYGHKLWGCDLNFAFPIAKLLDYKDNLEALEQNPNPFAVVTLAHLQAQATRKAPNARLEWKLRLVKGLYDRGYSKKDILELFRFIDWILALPEDLTLAFKHALDTFEEQRQMRYVTSIERMGVQQGLQQGVQQGSIQQGQACVVEVLEVRFGAVPATITKQICTIEDTNKLKTLHRQAITIESLARFQQILLNPPQEDKAN